MAQPTAPAVGDDDKDTKTFHPFKDLPLEIRLDIWGLAIPRNRVICFEATFAPVDEIQEIEIHTTKPAILQVNRESREQALKLYFLWTAPLSKKSVYINFKFDIFSMSENTLLSILGMLDRKKTGIVSDYRKGVFLPLLNGMQRVIFSIHYAFWPLVLRLDNPANFIIRRAVGRYCKEVAMCYVVPNSKFRKVSRARLHFKKIHFAPETIALAQAHEKSGIKIRELNDVFKQIETWCAEEWA